MIWKNFRQLKGQIVQDYTQEFRKRALLLGVNLNSQDTLLKYIGGMLTMLDPITCQGISLVRSPN